MLALKHGDRTDLARPLGLWLAPAPIIHHIGVIGPSALIGVLRLAFVLDAPARRAARVGGVALLAAYAAAILLA